MNLETVQNLRSRWTNRPVEKKAGELYFRTDCESYDSFYSILCPFLYSIPPQLMFSCRADEQLNAFTVMEGNRRNS